MTAAKVTAALLAGLATGVVVSLLYAPQAGSKTRRQLNNSLNKLGLIGQFQENVVNPIKSALGVSQTYKYPDYPDQAFI